MARLCGGGGSGTGHRLGESLGRGENPDAGNRKKGKLYFQFITKKMLVPEERIAMKGSAGKKRMDLSRSRGHILIGGGEQGADDPGFGQGSGLWFREIATGEGKNRNNGWKKVPPGGGEKVNFLALVTIDEGLRGYLKCPLVFHYAKKRQEIRTKWKRNTRR